jgi:hypothetical protein
MAQNGSSLEEGLLASEYTPEKQQEDESDKANLLPRVSSQRALLPQYEPEESEPRDSSIKSSDFATPGGVVQSQSYSSNSSSSSSSSSIRASSGNGGYEESPYYSEASYSEADHDSRTGRSTAMIIGEQYRWRMWPGNNKFCLNGRLMFGCDVKYFVASNILIIGPYIFFLLLKLCVRQYYWLNNVAFRLSFPFPLFFFFLVASVCLSVCVQMGLNEFEAHCSRSFP